MKRKRMFEAISREKFLEETPVKEKLIVMYETYTDVVFWKEITHNQYYIQNYGKETGNELIAFRYKKNIIGKWFVSYREGGKSKWTSWKRIVAVA